jgi:putative membrane protein
MMKPMLLAAVFGLMVSLFLTITQGIPDVLNAFASVGVGVLWITLLRLLQIAGASLAWWILLPDAGSNDLKACFLLRWVRDSVNSLLPVAQIGGEIVGARLLSLWCGEGGLAGASVLVDLLLQTVTLLILSFIGVLLLAKLGGDSAVVVWVLLGLLVSALAVAGFFVAQRRGGFLVLEHALLRLAQNPAWSILATVANLHDRLQAIHRRRDALACAALVHLVVWSVGALEMWIALAYMGYSVGYLEALAIESLGQAVRAAGFLIPAGLGVQEGGLVAACAIVGIPAHAGIALSLTKRVPELVLGLPGLLIWQSLEGRAGEVGRAPEGANAP